MIGFLCAHLPLWLGTNHYRWLWCDTVHLGGTLLREAASMAISATGLRLRGHLLDNDDDWPNALLHPADQSVIQRTSRRFQGKRWEGVLPRWNRWDLPLKYQYFSQLLSYLVLPLCIIVIVFFIFLFLCLA